MSAELKTCIGQRSQLIDGVGLRFDLNTGSDDNLDATGFVIEFKSRIFAYQNRCPHLGVELDWAPGEFFDAAQKYLVCSTHGARFKPDTGKCVSGPCVGQSLTPLVISKKKNKLYLKGD